MRFELSLLIVTVCWIAQADSLECYNCQGISDPHNCNATTLCSTNQACYIQTKHSSADVSYDLGCSNNQLCSSLSLPSIGRRHLYKRQQTNCHECCSNNLCNINLCSHGKPTTCIDDGTFDCARANSIFNMCKDTNHAATVCPRFCGLCNVVDGNWTPWSEWSVCDVTCENGTQTRVRTCSNPSPEHGGLNCTGEDMQMKSCTKQLCPIHGGWSVWELWGSCSLSCDVGLQSRRRTCTNPRPDRYGDNCFGDDNDYRICTPGPCANGSWSSWHQWNSCSVTCGSGLRQRQRVCDIPKLSYWLQCIGSSEQTEMCTKVSCEDTVVAFNVHHMKEVRSHILIFDQINLNVGNGYSSTTGYFTAPVKGLYMFFAKVCKSSSGSFMEYDIVEKRANATTSILNRAYASGAGYHCPELSVSVELNINDVVYVHMLASTSYMYQDSNIWHVFSGSLIKQYA